MRKSLVKQLQKQLAIPLGNQNSHAKWLVALQLLSFAVAFMISASASAVGMGGINVVSALGQQLKADIELVAVSKTESPSLAARLASPDAYKSAGLEYPYGNNFKFQIDTRADGEPYLKVSSLKPINDPFVTLLVELTWSSGKLSREFTFLLDPPGYVPQQPAQAEVQAVAPAVEMAASGVPAAEPMETEAATVMPLAPPETVTTMEVPTAASEVPGAPTEAETVPVEVEQTEVAAEKAVAKPMTGAVPADIIAIPENPEWLVVRRGDTMTEIAEQYRLADISLERMLVALYRANVDKFDAKNMNRIRAGKILHLPKQEDIETVKQSDAIKEIRAQAADWNAYRQKLASAAATRKESQSVQQVAAGKISSSVADQTPVAKETAKEVLKLSKGEAPGDQVAAGGAAGAAMSAQDKKNAAQEEMIAKSNAVKEEKMRTAMLEKNIQDMQRLAQLKAEMAQPPVVASSQVAVTSPLAVAASGVAAASAVKPVAVAKPKPAVVPPPEPSLVDIILDEPLYLMGGAAALLALGGAGFVVYRRKKKPFQYEEISEDESNEVSEDVAPVSGHIAAPVAPSPDTGDFTSTVVSHAAEIEDNVDPISEADLFLNFGRDAQAEEILKEALKSTPNNHQIHLKLLGIYANRQDAAAFSAIASALKDSGDEAAWQEAVEMGLKLDPNNPMYGGSGSGNAAASQQTTAFDVSRAPAATPVSGMDFDLGAADKTVVMSAGDMSAAPQPTTMDFDVAAPSPAASEANEPAAPDLADLIFNVTGSQPATPAEQPAAAPVPATDGGMEFTIDFSVAETAKPAPAAQAAEGDFAGISLDLGETPSSGGSTSGGKNDHWQEVATKLDLAKAYQEMGDADGVREILAEVLNEGDAEQQETAKSMLKQLG